MARRQVRSTIARLFAAVLVATALALPALAESLALKSAPTSIFAAEQAEEPIGKLEFRGGIMLRASDRRFGGLSGLRVSADGTQLTAISDQGYWLTATLAYDNRGFLTAAGNAAIGNLTAENGRPLTEKRVGDAESLERVRGGWLVGFERAQRIMLYRDADQPFARAAPFPTPPGLAAAPPNEGLEALASLPDGRLLAITEGFITADGDLRGWIFEAAGWRTLSYVRTGLFQPSDAVALPNGDVLVLERRFSYLGGFGSRIVRLRFADIAPDARLHGEEIALIERPLVTENFEGIAMRAAANGETLLYIVSDDNYQSLQKTLLFMFALKD
jgi:hypothetical protein